MRNVPHSDQQGGEEGVLSPVPDAPSVEHQAGHMRGRSEVAASVQFLAILAERTWCVENLRSEVVAHECVN